MPETIDDLDLRDTIAMYAAVRLNAATDKDDFVFDTKDAVFHGFEFADEFLKERARRAGEKS